MSILINGMEMPNNCPSCPFLVKNWYDAEFRCLVRKEYVKVNLNTGFDDDCPLVSVPMHGRLIDADAINYTMLYKEDWMNRAGVEAPAVWKKDIDAAPTVIEATESE